MLKTSILFLAGILLTLHSIIPHQHSKDPFHSHTISFENSFDLLDFLCFVFDEDIGENHLDKFPVQSSTIPFLADLPHAIFDGDLSNHVVENSTKWYAQNEAIISIFSPHALRGRAPPTC